MTAPPKVNFKRARLKDAILAKWDARVPIEVIARDLNCGTNTVRRSVDEHRPGERLARAAPKACTAQECQGCHEVFPIEEYPFRSDRPDKRHARCTACLRDWRRTWQHENPERNREGVRRRRARLRISRTEEYRDGEIYERDEGLCFFCRLPVDRALKYPDRKSMVVHHLHPIAKNGPDIRKNVALAHYDCNQKAKDRYQSPFSAWVAHQIPVSLARKLVIEHHYLHRMAPMSFAFGLSDGADILRGVISFGSPSSWRTVCSVTEARTSKVLELNRLWISDDAPFGAGSWFIPRALRMLPAAIIIAYADTEITDPRYGTCHDGAIYRACSFLYSGTSRPSTEWRLPGSSRNSGRVEGAKPVHVSPKARYWTITGPKIQRRALRKECLWPSLEYLPRTIPARKKGASPETDGLLLV